MQNGDVLQIKLFQSLTGIEGELLNVFYYQVGNLTTEVSLSANAEGIGEGIGLELVQPMTTIQTIALSHVRVEVNNLMDYVGDYLSWVYNEPITGDVSGEYNSAAVAWSFQLTRSTRSTRHGSKRIAGVPETYVANNVAVAGTVTTTLNAFAALIGNPIFIDFGGTDELELIPVILKSPVSTVVAPAIINPVATAEYRGVGTQNSRKQLLP